MTGEKKRDPRRNRKEARSIRERNVLRRTSASSATAVRLPPLVPPNTVPSIRDSESQTLGYAAFRELLFHGIILLPSVNSRFSHSSGLLYSQFLFRLTAVTRCPANKICWSEEYKFLPFRTCLANRKPFPRPHEQNRTYDQQVAAQQELEASEHRVHVMAADIASLQRKLAEHADVIRHGRALADKVQDNDKLFPFTYVRRACRDRMGEGTPVLCEGDHRRR